MIAAIRLNESQLLPRSLMILGWEDLSRRPIADDETDSNVRTVRVSSLKVAS